MVVLGAGGLGWSVIQNLAGLGVARMTMLDYDTVELHNFARQFTYREAQLGLPKVERVGAWLREFDADAEVGRWTRGWSGPTTSGRCSPAPIS